MKSEILTNPVKGVEQQYSPLRLKSLVKPDIASQNNVISCIDWFNNWINRRKFLGCFTKSCVFIFLYVAGEKKISACNRITDFYIVFFDVCNADKHLN